MIRDYFLQDRIDNWRATALILTSILFVAAGIWFIGKLFLNPRALLVYRFIILVYRDLLYVCQPKTMSPCILCRNFHAQCG